jgi:hypothetical protein
MTAGERPAARRALQAAARPRRTTRRATTLHPGRPGVRELLVHQLGSFGTAETFAQRALAAGAGGGNPHTTLSERELTVLGLLPSMLSLDEIAADLTVSVEHRQKPRPIHLHQTRRQQPPHRRPLRPRNRPPHQHQPELTASTFRTQRRPEADPIASISNLFTPAE